jgi:NAD(P)-dependent dehydrogenase (short-subunit alcohol dehydrogenase family)
MTGGTSGLRAVAAKRLVEAGADVLLGAHAGTKLTDSDCPHDCPCEASIRPTID